jgi:hypothetical protein
MVLYLLLRDVNRLAAAAMVTFAAIGAGIQIQNQVNQYTALTVAARPASCNGHTEPRCVDDDVGSIACAREPANRELEPHTHPNPAGHGNPPLNPRCETWG